jgi:hypothetical protein
MSEAETYNPHDSESKSRIKIIVALFHLRLVIATEQLDKEEINL